ACIATRRGGVDAQSTLHREAMQVVRTARLRTRAGEPFAAERLHADYRADHVAVDIGIADPQALMNAPHRLVDAAMNAERQAVAGGRDGVEDTIKGIAAPAHDVKDRTEHFAGQQVGPLDLEDARRK